MKDQPSHMDPTGEGSALVVAEAMGHLMHFWGLRRNLGRIWAYLYLWPRPLSAPDLAEKLELSPAAVSMALTELLQWQVVHRTWLTGDRRPHYVAETAVWKMVTKVLREREAKEIENLIARLREAKALLGSGRRGAAHAGPPPARSEARAILQDASSFRSTSLGEVVAFREERIGSLIELAELGSVLLLRVLEGGQLGLQVLARLKKPLVARIAPF